MTGHDAAGPDDAQPRPSADDDTAGPTPLDEPPLDEPAPLDDTAPLEEAAAPGDAAPLDDTASHDETAPLEPAPGQGPEAIGPTGTAVLPPVPGEPGALPRPRWAGRAAVSPPPQVETYGEPGFEEPRSIVVPVLVTVCVMLLLGVFALGAWLILSNRPGPAPSPTATQTTASTTPPFTVTTGPTTATPTGVAIPAVTGLDYEAAASILSSVGLTPERSDEFDEAEVGQVLRTEPPEGTLVPPGTTVTVIVSRGPQPAPTTTAPTAPPSSAEPS